MPLSLKTNSNVEVASVSLPSPGASAVLVGGDQVRHPSLSDAGHPQGRGQEREAQHGLTTPLGKGLR